MDFDFLPYFRRDFTSWRKSLRAWDWRHSTRITTPVLSLPVSQSIEVKINNCFPSCCLAHSLVEIEEKENSHFLRWNHVLAYELAYLMMNYIFINQLWCLTEEAKSNFFNMVTIENYWKTNYLQIYLYSLLNLFFGSLTIGP